MLLIVINSRIKHECRWEMVGIKSTSRPVIRNMFTVVTVRLVCDVSFYRTPYDAGKCKPWKGARIGCKAGLMVSEYYARGKLETAPVYLSWIHQVDDMGDGIFFPALPTISAGGNSRSINPNDLRYKRHGPI